MQLSLFRNDLPGPVQLEYNGYTLSIQYCDDYQRLVEVFEQFIAKNVRIFEKLHKAAAIVIKVNLTSGELPSKGRTTNPLVLEQLVIALHLLGISFKQITVADSSVIGVNTLEAAKICGITDICEKYEINFFDLNEGPFANVQVKEEDALISSIPIHQLFTDKQLFLINLAKIKTTYGSPIGFCIKNLKGVISNETKLDFHLKGVQDCLVALRTVVTCDLNILEGFPGSELGNPKECNLIGISEDDLLLDCAIAELIGISHSEVPHLGKLVKVLNRSLTPVLSDNALFSSLYDIAPKFQFAAHGIADMCAEFAIEIIDGRPCTACVESFYKALRKLADKGQLLYDYIYVMGLWHIASNWEEDVSKYVFVGSCALQSLPAQRLVTVKPDKYPGDSVILHGCPPTIDDMIQKLSVAYTRQCSNIASDDAEAETSVGQCNVIPFSSRHSQYIYEWMETLPLSNYFTADAIRNVLAVVPNEEVTFGDLGLTTAIQCELVNAAICHRMNWDFLRRKIREVALMDPSYWSFERLQKISKNDIDDLLRGYPKLDRYLSEQRAAMLREVADFSAARFNYFQEILCSADNFIAGDGGLLYILRANSVFGADPEKKKAQVFIHALLRAGLWSCKDVENIRPAVDYHIMRLYLRRGNIAPANQYGAKYIWDNVTRRAPTTNAFRSLVAEAMIEIGQYANESLINVNGAEWWVGRSICTSESPDCHLERPGSEWLRASFRHCPYLSNCFAQTVDNSLLKILEPREKSTYY